MSRYALLLAVLAAVILSDAVAAGPKKKLRKQAKDMKDQVLQMKAEIADLKKLQSGVGQCGSNKVHFMFHDGHDDHDHDGHEDDVHVHVHLFNGDHGDNHDHKHSAACQFGGKFSDIDAYIVQDESAKFANFKFSFHDHVVDGYEVHVHENGDLTKGCAGLGGHYDPIEPKKDVGDLGSIKQSKLEDGMIWVNNTMLTLLGKHSILGRSIVLHNADGDRLACCIIGRAADDHDHHDHDSHDHHDGHDHGKHHHHGHDGHDHH